MAVTRKYEIEAMSNGYSIKILEANHADGPMVWATVAHFVVGGLKANTKPETLQRKIVAYGLTELKKQLEKALEEADRGRPELPLDESTAD